MNKIKFIYSIYIDCELHEACKSFLFIHKQFINLKQSYIPQNKVVNKYDFFFFSSRSRIPYHQLE